MKTSTCIPPHSVSDKGRIGRLCLSFSRYGWGEYPALVGYVWQGRVQLLSGSHRWAAAQQVGLSRIPVVVVPYMLVEASWGSLPAWKRLMAIGGEPC